MSGKIVESRCFPETLANQPEGHVIIGTHKKKQVVEFCMDRWDAVCLLKSLNQDPLYKDLTIYRYDEYLQFENTIDKTNIKIPFGTRLENVWISGI